MNSCHHRVVLIGSLWLLAVGISMFLGGWHAADAYFLEAYRFLGSAEKALAPIFGKLLVLALAGALTIWVFLSNSVARALLWLCLLAFSVLGLSLNAAIAGYVYEPLSALTGALGVGGIAWMLCRQRQTYQRLLEQSGLTRRLSPETIEKLLGGNVRLAPEVEERYEVALVTMKADDDVSLTTELAEDLRRAARALLDAGGYLERLNTGTLQVFFNIPKGPASPAKRACLGAEALREALGGNFMAWRVSIIVDEATLALGDDGEGRRYGAWEPGLLEKGTALADRPGTIIVSDDVRARAEDRWAFTHVEGSGRESRWEFVGEISPANTLNLQEPSEPVSKNDA